MSTPAASIAGHTNELFADPVDFLTPVQLQVIHLLAEGKSITAAAQAAGIHRTTVHYWRTTNLEFGEVLRDACADVSDHWRAECRKHAEAAVHTIHQLMTDPNTPPSIRLKAALAILTPACQPPARRTQQELDREQFVRRAHAQHAARKAAEEEALETERTEAVAEAEDKLAHLSIVPAPPQTYVRPGPKTGRNEKCPCGSNRKFKHCCLLKTAA